MTPPNLTKRRELEPVPHEPDCRDTDWSRFVQTIEDLLATGQFTWAQATLRGIQATVLKQQRVTSAQRRAVWSIEAGNHWRGRRR